MNVYQLSTLLTGILSLLIGSYLLMRHEGSEFHRTYGRGIITAGVYVLLLFGFSVAQSEQEAWRWLRISAIVHLIPAISLHAILIFSISFQQFTWRRKLFFIYIPFLFFVVQDFVYPQATYRAVTLTPYGWVSVFNNSSVLQFINMVLYLLCIALQIFLLIEVLIKSAEQTKRRFALFVLFAYIMPMLATFFLTFIFTYFNPEILRIETMFVFFSCLSTIFCLYRFNIFDVSIEIVATEIVEKMSNFLLLLDRKCNVAFINPKAQELLEFKSEELRGNSISRIIGEGAMQDVFSGEREHHTSEIFVQSRSRSFPAMISVAQVKRKQELIGYILIGNDLSNVYGLREEKKIAELELKALLRQMNPHFLFNSLNTVQFYISRNEEEQANEYLSRFSVLMRSILEASEKNSICLKDEIDTINLYLEMESARFAGKFSYTIDVQPDISQAEVNIPPMIIQPFIENAIWHGLLPKHSDRQLAIAFELTDQHLLCVVEDNGIGRKRSGEINKLLKPQHRSTAIRNIQERVQLINKQIKNIGIRINIEDRINPYGSPEGTRVEISFPLSFQMN